MSLGDERLSTTDSKGGRLFLYPAEVKGVFRKYRNYVQAVLIVFFLILPWIQWKGQQLLLLDIPNRSFHILGAIFKAHDAPFIFLILALGTITLAVVTALFGRVWCGWACPQTVFIDGVYRRIETWVQGRYLERRKLASQNWNFTKIRKISLTWFLYFIVSAFIAHSFAAYFVGSSRLLQMMRGTPDENWTVFVLIASITLILLFNFGWFREQFCLIACPYGRIQAALMDKKSLSVLYDYKRGEPRKALNVSKELQGDCVSCNRCVEVCPTGIDIRRGIQMECIGCTACIDACDEIMTKVNKPKGLIRYTSEYEIENKISVSWRDRILRPRVILYFLIVISVAVLLGILLQARDTVMISVLKAKDAPYSLLQESAQESVLNHMKLHIYNQGHSDSVINIGAVDGIELVLPQKTVTIPSNQSKEIHFFAKFPKSLSRQHQGSFKKNLNISIISDGQEKILVKELTFVGPF